MFKIDVMKKILLSLLCMVSLVYGEAEDGQEQQAPQPNISQEDLQRLNQLFTELMNLNMSLSIEQWAVEFNKILQRLPRQDVVDIEMAVRLCRELPEKLKLNDTSSLEKIEQGLSKLPIDAGLRYYFIFTIYKKSEFLTQGSPYRSRELYKYRLLSAQHGFRKAIIEETEKRLSSLSPLEKREECAQMIKKLPQYEKDPELMTLLHRLLIFSDLKSVPEMSMEEALEWVWINQDKLMKNDQYALVDAGAALLFYNPKEIKYKKRGVALLERFAMECKDLHTLFVLIYFSGSLIPQDEKLIERCTQTIRKLVENQDAEGYGTAYLSHEKHQEKEMFNRINNSKDPEGTFIQVSLELLDKKIKEEKTDIKRYIESAGPMVIPRSQMRHIIEEGQ